MLKVILAGSDKLENKDLIYNNTINIISVIQYKEMIPCKDLEFISKASRRGTDWHISKLAKQYSIKIKDFKSNWNDLNELPCFPKPSFYGMINSSAGYNANDRIVEYAKGFDTIAILFDDGDIGIKDLIKKCKRYTIKTWQIKCKDTTNVQVKVWN